MGVKRHARSKQVATCAGHASDMGGGRRARKKQVATQSNTPACAGVPYTSTKSPAVMDSSPRRGSMAVGTASGMAT